MKTFEQTSRTIGVTDEVAKDGKATSGVELNDARNALDRKRDRFVQSSRTPLKKSRVRRFCAPLGRRRWLAFEANPCDALRGPKTTRASLAALFRRLPHRHPHRRAHRVDQREHAGARDVPKGPAVARRQTLREGADLVDRSDDVAEPERAVGAHDGRKTSPFVGQDLAGRNEAGVETSANAMRGCDLLLGAGAMAAAGRTSTAAILARAAAA